MLFKNDFINVRKAFSLFSICFKCVKIKPNALAQCRSLTSNEGQLKNSEYVNRSREDKSSPYCGYDDPAFTSHLYERLKDPRSFKRAVTSILKECKQFCDEEVTNFKKFADRNIASNVNRVDMLFMFDTEYDLRKFTVNTDSSFLAGYSSASLKITQSRTALFSGNICTDLPKDGNIAVAGYANMITRTQRKSFNRIKCFDWSEYTHLVLKIRGDGRNYLIILTTPNEYVEHINFSYAHVLYTRGGPYWQIVKIPFSHFYALQKATILPDQNSPIQLRIIQKIGITAAGFDGPFKLEIEYIGLEYDPFHKKTSPYEEYRKTSFI